MCIRDRGYADNNSQLKVANDGEKKYSGRLNADYQATDRSDASRPKQIPRAI